MATSVSQFYVWSPVLYDRARMGSLNFPWLTIFTFVRARLYDREMFLRSNLQRLYKCCQRECHDIKQLCSLYKLEKQQTR